jgi:hypothetical protein
MSTHSGIVHAQLPKRTASELEQMILAQAVFERACPRELKMKVVPVDGKWDVAPEIIDKNEFPHCLPRLLEIASVLRGQFDLDSAQE